MLLILHSTFYFPLAVEISNYTLEVYMCVHCVLVKTRLGTSVDRLLDIDNYP